LVQWQFISVFKDRAKAMVTQATSVSVNMFTHPDPQAE
jgi:hypothetical protein